MSAAGMLLSVEWRMGAVVWFSGFDLLQPWKKGEEVKW